MLVGTLLLVLSVPSPVLVMVLLLERKQLDRLVLALVLLVSTLRGCLPDGASLSRDTPRAQARSPSVTGVAANLNLKHDPDFNHNRNYTLSLLLRSLLLHHSHNAYDSIIVPNVNEEDDEGDGGCKPHVSASPSSILSSHASVVLFLYYLRAGCRASLVTHRLRSPAVTPTITPTNVTSLPTQTAFPTVSFLCSPGDPSVGFNSAGQIAMADPTSISFSPVSKVLSSYRCLLIFDVGNGDRISGFSNLIRSFQSQLGNFVYGGLRCVIYISSPDPSGSGLSSSAFPPQRMRGAHSATTMLQVTRGGTYVYPHPHLHPRHNYTKNDTQPFTSTKLTTFATDVLYHCLPSIAALAPEQFKPPSVTYTHSPISSRSRSSYLHQPWP
ncbi:hypothetical protein CPB84DRAFT_1854586 [Gymnopilus junonius]|uniref:Uncharacterized protein n=1 Tax=Gymnopilus junonius TaxID=109634 RepID=A0A9P5N8F2_GYMJU|nr:hypothetical protein CPB84DRAFT_1854586 [Gymnopilus junonius]